MLCMYVSLPVGFPLDTNTLLLRVFASGERAEITLPFRMLLFAVSFEVFAVSESPRTVSHSTLERLLMLDLTATA